MTTFDETAKRRIRYLTRRGLLELDILLRHFMENGFDGLSDAELAVFADMLDLPDPEFLAYANGKEVPQNAAFLPLLDKIRSASLQP